ncbi:MAG TPA: 4Fe-4S binding protein [Phycisphaerae bacterium]|nr:4Fe-4S binding protein [Phycisphaerae bacterium]
MAHVITELCIGTKSASCEAICPVSCIHPGPDEQMFEHVEMLYINPSACIDCGLCVDVCPVGAIHHTDDLPPEMKHYAAINADYFKSRRPG